jgi:hydrogenase nickel incorporation protein HypA/HybF
MHEWSVADAVIRTVIDWADGKKIKVRKVVLGVPSFSFLDVEILKEAFDMMKKDSVLDEAELEVKFKEPKFKCKNCGKEFSLNEVKDQIDSVRSEFGEEYPMHFMPALAPSFIKCPYCGSHDIALESQDMTIDEIQVEENGTVKTVSQG